MIEPPEKKDRRADDFSTDEENVYFARQISTQGLLPEVELTLSLDGSTYFNPSQAVMQRRQILNFR